MNSTSTQRFTVRTAAFALAGVLVLGAAGIVAALAWSSRTPAPAAGAAEQVIIAANTEYVGTCPVTIAHANGYFAHEGVAAVIQRHNSGKASLEAALAGKADLATTADIPIMLAAMAKVPVSVIGTFFRTDRDHGIVGRRDRGVGTPAGLKGKRIGVTVGTSGHFVLDAFVNRQRLAASDVTLHNLKPDELVAALAGGKIDAIAGWEPFLGKAQAQLGTNATVFYGEDIYEIPYSLAGTRDYVTGHPELMKKVLRALIRGARYCHDERDAALAIMGKVLSVDTGQWKQQWGSFHFNVALDQGLILALEDEARWAVTNKLAADTAMPNFLDYVYLDALDAVAPSTVTVIH